MVGGVGFFPYPLMKQNRKGDQATARDEAHLSLPARDPPRLKFQLGRDLRRKTELSSEYPQGDSALLWALSAKSQYLF